MYPYDPTNPPAQTNWKPFFKKEIRRDAGRAGVVMIILFLLTNVLSGILSAVLTFLTYAGGQVLAFGMAPPSFLPFGVYMFLLSCFPYIVVDIVCIFIARALFKVPMKEMFCKNEGGVMLTLFGIPAVIGCGVIGSVVYSFFSYLLSLFQLEVPAPSFSSMMGDPLSTILLLSYACLIGPILEEILFRGFLLKFLQRHGDFFAIVVTSILFCLFHMNLAQFVSPLLMGVLLGFITVKSRSILPAIICHICNNSLVFALEYAFPAGSSLQGLGYFIYFAGTLLLLILFCALYLKDLFSLPNKAAPIPTASKVAAAFSSPAMLIFVVFYLLNIFLSFIMQFLVDRYF